MSIHNKLAAIQGALRAPKSQKNSFGGYAYRSCEDILQAVKPLLGDYSLLINDELVFSGMLEDEIIGAGDKAMKVQTQRVYIKATVTLTSSDGKESVTASAMAREASIKKGMDASQVSGATSSYARKYALNGMFAIDDNKDADTDQHKSTVDAGQDMLLEGLAGKPSAAPKKRINKELMQTSLNTLVEAYKVEDDAGMSETWSELERHEQEHIWHQLNGKQQSKIRAVTFKGEVA